MRFYEQNIDKKDLETNYNLSQESSHHFSKVLRGKIDQRICLFSGRGGQFFAKVKKIDRNCVTAYVESFDENDNLPRFSQSLAFAMTNNQKTK